MATAGISGLEWLSLACVGAPRRSSSRKSLHPRPGLTAGAAAPGAQLGGTDNPPAEAAWPTPARLGAPPMPAGHADPVAAA